MSALPVPVDLERIRNLLDSQNRDFGAHGTGAWSVTTTNAFYLWSLENPQVLQIRGQWRGIATTPTMLDQLRQVIGRCNFTRTIPKSYTLPLANGNYGLMTECNILTNGGLSHRQFFDFCESSLGAIMEFFGEAEKLLPDFVTWEPHGE